MKIAFSGCEITLAHAIEKTEKTIAAAAKDAITAPDKLRISLGRRFTSGVSVSYLASAAQVSAAIGTSEFQSVASPPQNGASSALNQKIMDPVTKAHTGHCQDFLCAFQSPYAQIPSQRMINILNPPPMAPLRFPTFVANQATR